MGPAQVRNLKVFMNEVRPGLLSTFTYVIKFVIQAHLNMCTQTRRIQTVACKRIERWGKSAQRTLLTWEQDEREYYNFTSLLESSPMVRQKLSKSLQIRKVTDIEKQVIMICHLL